MYNMKTKNTQRYLSKKLSKTKKYTKRKRGKMRKLNQNISSEIKDTIEYYHHIIPKIKKINTFLLKQKKSKRGKEHFRTYTSSHFVKKENAIATIIFMSEDYIPALLVLAHSFRLHHASPKHNLICLVQDKSQTVNNICYEGIRKSTIQLLLHFFDIIYGIDLLYTTPNYDSDWVQKHYKHAHLYLTKCQIFNIIDFKNILYIDASSLILQNIDNIFDKKYRGGVGWRIERKNKEVGFSGKLIFFQPSIFYAQKLKYLLDNIEIFEHYKSIRHFNESLIMYVLYDSKPFRLIDSSIICRDYTNMWKQCVFIHYEYNKPFRQNEKEEFNDSNKYITWDNIASDLLTKHPSCLIYFEHIKTFRKVNYLD